MPMFPEGQDPLGSTGLATQPAVSPPQQPFRAEPTTPQIFGAAIQDNSLYAATMGLAHVMGDASIPSEPGYDVMQDIKGTPYETNYLSSFLSSRSSAETQAIKARIADADQQRQILASAGWAGTTMSLATGLLEPTNYLPIIGEYSGALKGASVAGRVGGWAATGALGSTINEGVLQATQDGRPWSESMRNIATNTLFMGLLGGAHAYLLPHEVEAGVKNLDAMRRDFSPETPADAVDPNVRGAATEAPGAALRPEDFGLGIQPQPGGAAATDTRTMVQKPFAPVPQVWRDAVPIIDKAANAFEATNNALSPIGRLFSSESIAARRATADLAETVRGFEQNVARPILDSEGRQVLDIDGKPAFSEPQTTTFDGQVPVDRQSKMLIAKGRVLANDALAEAYAEYRYQGSTPRLAGLQQGIEELRGKTPDGKLTYAQFKAEVSQALYSADTHDIPQVQRAAREIRQKVLDPVKERAQTTIGPDGQPMLAEGDLVPKGDQSLFPRIWNKIALGAKRGEAVSRFTNWLSSEQEAKRAIQAKIEGIAGARKALRQTLGKIEGRIASIEKRQNDTVARQKERVSELNSADRREQTVAERHAETQREIEELQGHIDALRDQIRDPEAKMRLEDLERHVAELRANERASTATPAGLAEQDRAEVASTFANPDFRQAAEVFVGKRKAPKPDSFLSYLVRNGGVAGGDEERAALRDVRRPGLLRRDQRSLLGSDIIRNADDWGEKLMQDFPHAFNGERPTQSEVLDIMREATHGRDPWWFHHDAAGNADHETHIQSIVDTLHDLFEHRGSAPTTMKDLARALNGEHGISLADLQEDLRRMDEAGAAVPPGIEREAGEARLAQMRAARQEIRDAISRSIQERQQVGRKLGKDAVRLQEAQVPVTRSENRFADLQARSEREQMLRDILEEQRGHARKMHDDLTAHLEESLRQWRGDTTAEAMQALKAREKAEAARAEKIAAGEYKGRGERLSSADSAVDRAIKRILESDQTLSRQELQSRANEIVDRILSSPDGRLNYENGGMGPEVGAFTKKQEVRGSLNHRDFAIPTALVKEFVEHDTEHVIQSFLRGVVPDILLTERFGDAHLETVMRKVNEDYAAKTGAAATEREAARLEARRQADIRDIAAIRDRIKGVYGWSPDPRLRSAARVAGVFRNWNMLADLGTSVVSRFNEMSNGVFRYGFEGMFRGAWRPYFRALTGLSSEQFVGRGRAQMKALGIGIDGRLGHLAASLADVTDGYQPGSKFERVLQVAADRSMLVNLHTQQTDEMKMLTGLVAANEFLATAEKISLGKATAKDLERMASANITPDRAKEIWRDYSAGGGSKIDGVHVPNTADWTPAARLSFEAAMQREAEAVVMIPGQERPLWISHPVAGLLGQYKGVVAAMHERLFIGNLQQRDFKTVQGLFASVALGMLSYRIYTLLAGQEVSDRPQDWIKEGLARSGATGWLTEMNAMQARFTGGKTDLYRLIGADRPLTRHEQRSALSEMLGPTYSRLEGMSNALGDAAMTKKDGTTAWNAIDTHKMRQLLPFQNLFFLRRMLDEAEDHINGGFGVKPLDRTPKSFQPQQ